MISKLKRLDRGYGAYDCRDMPAVHKQVRSSKRTGPGADLFLHLTLILRFSAKPGIERVDEVLHFHPIRDSFE